MISNNRSHLSCIVCTDYMQLLKEYDELPKGKGDAALPDAPWGIISIKASRVKSRTALASTCLLRGC